jgi:dsDNA-binding SOS-regulon protein
VFDHTAIDSAFRFAGKMQQDLWPAGSENFQLEPGPVVRDQAQREELSAYLANTTAICQAFFDDGAFDMACTKWRSTSAPATAAC